jgi:hypothetical protein
MLPGAVSERGANQQEQEREGTRQLGRLHRASFDNAHALPRSTMADA